MEEEIMEKELQAVEKTRLEAVFQMLVLAGLETLKEKGH